MLKKIFLFGIIIIFSAYHYAQGQTQNNEQSICELVESILVNLEELTSDDMSPAPETSWGRVVIGTDGVKRVYLTQNCTENGQVLYFMSCIAGVPVGQSVGYAQDFCSPEYDKVKELYRFYRNTSYTCGEINAYWKIFRLPYYIVEITTTEEAAFSKATALSRILDEEKVIEEFPDSLLAKLIQIEQCIWKADGLIYGILQTPRYYKEPDK